MCRFDNQTSKSCNHSNDASVQCRLRDVLAPTLHFNDVPNFSTENITISWEYNEEATSFCTFQTSTIVMPVVCNNNTVTFTNLLEGFYSLYVQGTDLSNNTAAPVRVSWSVGMLSIFLFVNNDLNFNVDNVDLTPPDVMLTSFPPTVSQQTDWSFRFQCVNEFICTFMCSLHVVDTMRQFRDCSSGQLLADELQNDVQYEFAVRATDHVGNVGHLLTYQWRVGKFPVAYI